MSSILKIRLDEGGTSETRLAVWDFSARSEILAGDTLSGTPVLVQAAAPAGTPALTLGAPSIVSGSKQVQAAVSVVGGTAGSVYHVSCRCPTAGGAVLVVELRIEIQAAG